jgi:hypothetical protein
LIMLIVFLAVPALQRNSRNTSRRSDASHLAGLINEYASNHAGTLPTGYGAGAGQVDISGEKWALVQTPAAVLLNNTTPAPGVTDVLNVNKGFKCDQSTNTLTAGGGTRAFSVSFRVETSSSDAVACING